MLLLFSDSGIGKQKGMERDKQQLARDWDNRTDMNRCDGIPIIII